MTASSNQKTVLVVEDDETILFTVKEFLESEGYTVQTALNGFEALELLKKSEIPNVILLDMKMPIMNGWQFAIEFLDKHDHSAPIVVMTAAADAEQRAKDIGAIGWIEKPFDLNDLLKKVRMHERKLERTSDSQLEPRVESMPDRLRRQSGEILKLWEERVRAIVPAARSLDSPSLRNSIPLVLETLAKTLEDPEIIEEPKIEVAVLHGEERATLPHYSIDQVILEYRLLRRAIFEVLAPQGSVDASDASDAIDAIDARARNAIIDMIEVGIAKAAAAFTHYQFRLRERFISTLAHDLRTPIAGAKSCGQLMLRQPENIEATQRLSARVVDAMTRTNRMIEDLLDSNLVRTGGTLPLQIEQNDLRGIIKTTLEEATTAVGDHFKYEAGDIPIIGYWDIRYLKRAVENVALNAVKYGDSARPITVSVARAGQDVAIAIHNYGEPISHFDQEALFDPFQRGPKANHSDKRGWGIGLSLVKGVCEAHGGRVSVESHEQSGTTFTLTIPLDARAAFAKAA